MAGQVQPVLKFPISLFVVQAIDDLGIFQYAGRSGIVGQLVDGLQDDPYGPVLFSDSLIVEFHTLQYVVEFELFGELIEKDDALFRSVFPDGTLDGGLDQFEHHRKDFLIVLYLVQLKNDQALVLDFKGLVLADLEQEAVQPIADIFGHNVEEARYIEVIGLYFKLVQQTLLMFLYEAVKTVQGMVLLDHLIIIQQYLFNGDGLGLGGL